MKTMLALLGAEAVACIAALAMSDRTPAQYVTLAVALLIVGMMVVASTRRKR